MESKQTNESKTKVPITVFTGFLGAGKTTIIIDLLQKMNDPNIVLLKNEFGDTKVDSQLLDYQTIEISNGCLCCVLVGQMKNALLQLLDKNPSRIIIESSGSAYPAPIAWQIRELPEFHLDSIITVIDCVNFKGYEDTSYTARMQAQYTDLILLNKHELVTEREYDLVLDLVNDLNLDTGKLKWTRFLDPALFFGHDTLLFTDDNNKKIEDHHSREVDLISIKDDGSFTESEMDTLFSTMPKDQIYRVKGLFRMQNKFMVLNWAFGRWEWTETKKPIESTRITIMGIDLFEFIPKLKSTFQSVDFSPRKQY